MKISTGNVGRGTPETTRKTLRRLVRSLRVSSRSSWLLAQEIHDDAIDEARTLERLTDKVTAVRRTHALTSQPIIDRAPMWRRAGRDRIRVYGGIPKVTAPCWIAAAYYRHRTTGEKLAVLNLHLMHSPENGGRNKELWDQGWAALREEVHRLVDAGYDVIAAGDYNVRGWLDLPLEDLHPNAVEIARHGYDRIVAIPAHGRRVKHGKARNVPLPVERQHDLLSVTARFTNRRRRTR